MFTRFSLRDYNFKLLITVIIAMICGVVMINSADSSFTPKQTIGIGLGVIIMIFVSLLNYDFVCRFYRVFFIINAVILLSVIFLVWKSIMQTMDHDWRKRRYSVPAIRIFQDPYDLIYCNLSG